MRSALPSAAVLAALPLLAACTGSRTAAPAAPPFAFVTRLGADTVAVERVTPRRDGVDAVAVVRVPETTVTEYRLRLDANGSLTTYEAISHRPGQTAPVRTERTVRRGDSLRVEVTTPEGGTRVRTVAADERALPFVEMVHWPFDLALQRVPPNGRVVPTPMFTGSSTIAFTAQRGPNPITLDGRSGLYGTVVTHPTRGPMSATTDLAGHLVSLDAAATTRKLTVERVATVDVDALARRFAARDAAGAGVGALSGRATPSFTLGGATIAFDHGQPSARGRDLFGGIVPWGQRWRTGADLATHIETDRDLVLGTGASTLRVPAGRYTLSTLPMPAGGLLIVNRQTGQTGTVYSAAQDLGRVAMRRETALPYVERLTLRIVPTGADAGDLRIEWGSEAFVVPVRVAR